MKPNKNDLQNFSEKRLIFFSENGPAEGFQFSDGQKKEQEKVGNQAAEEFDKFQKEISSPQEKLKDTEKTRSAENKENGMGKTDIILLLKEFADQLFPGDQKSSIDYYGLLIESYNQNAPKNIKYENIAELKIKFTDTKFEVNAFDKNNKNTLKFDFPSLPKTLEQLDAKREEVKKDAIEQRENKQFDEMPIAITKDDELDSKKEPSPKDVLRLRVLGEDGIVKFVKEDGKKDYKLEQKTKLVDLFQSSEGDKIVITRVGKKPRIAHYDKTRDNYYYKKSDGSFGLRAIFLSGDKIKFEPRIQLQQSETEDIGQNSQSPIEKAQKYQEEVEERQAAYEVSEAQSTATILDSAQKYVEKDFKISKDVYQYVNDDEKWNDLWAKRGEAKDKYIDGLEKVIAILTDEKSFNLSENETRDALRKLIQIGRNHIIDFEDIFEMFGQNIYKEGDEEDLSKEIQKHRKVIDSWSKREADIQTMREFEVKTKSIKAKLDELSANSLDPVTITESEEYKAWEILRAKANPIQSQYTKKFIPAYKKFKYYTEKIFVPTAKLLEAIAAMRIKTSKQETFFDQTERLVALTGQLEITADSKPIYYDLAEMLKASSSEEKQRFQVGISKEALSDFAKKVAKGLEMKVVIMQQPEVMKMILGIYSIASLTAEGCIKREKGAENNLVIIALPKNFDLSNPAIKSLFTKQTENEVTVNQAKIEEVSQVIDNNKIALEKISQIFGDGPAMQTQINWLDSIGRWIAGEDTRSVELTMADIANGEVTRPTTDFLNRYMSADGAKSEVLSSIIKVKNGADFYDLNILQTALQQSLEVGMRTIKILGLKIPELQKLAGQVNGKDAELKAAIETFIKTPNAKIDPKLIELIRIGHVLGRTIEEGKEKFLYSESPEIASIQKAMVESQKNYSQQDLNKVEETLLGGLLIGIAGNKDTGKTSFDDLGLGTSIDLGDGWTLSGGIGVSEKGQVGVGADVSKTIQLSKNGRKALTFGVSAGYLVIGGHVSMKMPISESTDLSVGAGAGISAIGFYAMGGIGVRYNTQADLQDKFKQLSQEVGFDQVDQLIRSGASDEKIIQAITKLPEIGEEFRKLQVQYGLSTQGILELYNLKHDQLESKVTQDNSHEGFNMSIIGAGAFAGIVNGLPVVGGYLEIKLGEEIVIVRNETPGSKNQNKISEVDAQRLIRQKFARNVTFLDTKIQDSGNVILDSVTGRAVILEGKSELDLSQVDSFTQLDAELRENIDASIMQDPETKLTRINFNNVEGNLKILIDPAIQEQLILKGNKILITMGENPNFTFSREIFHDPFSKDGANKLTVITIKANPLRNRSQIERESQHFIYKRNGYLAEIRKGVADTRLGLDQMQAPDITSFAQYLNQKNKAEVRKGDFMERYDAFLKAREGIVKPGGELRTGIVPEKAEKGTFAEAFYDKFHLQYKESFTIGSRNYNPEKLVQEIQKFAADYEMNGEKVAQLSDIEMREVLTYLNVRGFSNIDNKAEKFKENLRFAKEKLTQYFEQIIAMLPKNERPGYTAAEMATYMIDELKGTNFDGEKAKLPEGSRLLSIVGTEGIYGLRGVLSEGEKIKTGILNFKKYNLRAPGIEGDIARIILEANSPLETKDNLKFMKSQLALKFAAHSGLGFAIGMENATKVLESFKSGAISAENQAAFDTFKALVLKIREAQRAGKKIIQLENGIKIEVDTTSGSGAYEGCGNATMIIDEDIAIIVPQPRSIAVSRESFYRVTAKTERRDIEIVLGVKGIISEQAPAAPLKPGDKEVEIPDLKSGTKDVGAGDGGLVQPVSTGETESAPTPTPASPGSGSGRPIPSGQTGETG